MSKRKVSKAVEVKSYAQLCADFDTAEARGDVAQAAGIYRQCAGSVHYAALAGRMFKLWGLQ